ncbi:WcaI family glycosyltransferase [Flavobacterium sp.]|jgi:colanic acid biosynthesis glycosyl transferase WcaI|uniref:WcaI family glycosyltransferase n=1 Tax=Flavobacterium sp. TaxID=239 RepID=UPI0037BF0012
MNITIISNNYYPEDSGIGLYSTGMAEYLAQNHSVKVITAMPYYPQWEISSDYKNKPIYYSEIVNNVEIFRFKIYVPRKPTFFKRIFQMCHFFLGSIVNVFKIKKNDVVIVVMPYTISIILGLLIRFFKGGKLLVHVQDFEFDAAFETGLSQRSGLFPKLVFKLEHLLLNLADKVSTISYGMLKKLETKTVTPAIYFPNWIDYSKVNPEKAKQNAVFDTKKFNILYSGNIGAKQDWDFFVDFVKECKKIDKIHIYLIGEGAKKEELVNKIKFFGNCSYFPPVRYKDLNDLLCNADLHILFQKHTVVDTVMPSKILGMMASAKPSIVTGHEESEVKHNFEISKGGFYFCGENKLNQIITKINYLIESEKDVEEIGKNARKFVVEKFSMDYVLNKFEKHLL